MKPSFPHWPDLGSGFYKRDYDFTVTDPQSESDELNFLARRSKQVALGAVTGLILHASFPDGMLPLGLQVLLWQQGLDIRLDG